MSDLQIPRARQPWRPAPPAYMRVKAASRRVWEGHRPGGRGSDVMSMIAPERGARAALRERRRQLQRQ